MLYSYSTLSLSIVNLLGIYVYYTIWIVLNLIAQRCVFNYKKFLLLSSPIKFLIKEDLQSELIVQEAVVKLATPTSKSSCRAQTA